MYLSNNVYRNMLNAPSVPPESGGILGTHGSIVDVFHYDAGIPRLDAAEYTPDRKTLNLVLKDWSRSGIRFCGIMHTHPPGQLTLSAHDEAYIRTIMAAMPEEIRFLFFPIVIPHEILIPYAAFRSENQIAISKTSIILKEETS